MKKSQIEAFKTDGSGLKRMMLEAVYCMLGKSRPRPLLEQTPFEGFYGPLEATQIGRVGCQI